jgi:hypothetical protein
MAGKALARREGLDVIPGRRHELVLPGELSASTLTDQRPGVRRQHLARASTGGRHGALPLTSNHALQASSRMSGRSRRPGRFS